MKKIGILGSGAVAQSLGSGFLKHGFEVMLGTRNPAKLEEWKDKDKVRIGSMEKAAEFGELVVLAVRGKGAKSVLQLAGANNLKGKTVIDVTNPIDDEKKPVNGVLPYFTQMNDSLHERLQKQVPEAHLVKAFNSVGNAFMVNPDFGGQKPTMFICGNNDSAKEEVKGILDVFGWETEDMGKAEAARAIEPLCMLWCIPGFRENRWNHAFKLLKK